MGPPYGFRFPYYSHIFRDSNMGVGLGNSMGPAYHKGVPCPWGSLKIPLIDLKISGASTFGQPK